MREKGVNKKNNRKEKKWHVGRGEERKREMGKREKRKLQEVKGRRESEIKKKRYK